MITLELNRKGVLDLDTVKGCYYGMAENPNGCYGLCYAAALAKFRGLAFAVSVTRCYQTARNRWNILTRINNSRRKFVRIGTMGDPCLDWEHTLTIAYDVIKHGNKPVVIITKHWRVMSDKQVEAAAGCGIILNTSISALDTPEQRAHRLEQYRRYPGTSVLRVVSCDFNTADERGRELNRVQDALFSNAPIIDNPLRLNSEYPLYKQGVILASKVRDLKAERLISLRNKDTYIGDCYHCPDQCGVGMG